jgi:putative transposase
MRDRDAAVSSDLVKRDFTATIPDQIWAADITYVPTYAGFFFLAVVLDVCTRPVVGWGWQTTFARNWWLMRSTWRSRRKPKAVVHHCDHGSEYTSIAFALH